MAEADVRNNGDRNGVSADEEEYRHFLRIINAYKRYKICSLNKLAKTEKYLCELPEHHRELLSGYKEHLYRVSDCIARNDLVIQQILQHVNMFEEASPFQVSMREEKDIGPPTLGEIDKVIATIKQLVRDWSKDGEEERNACYLPIIEEIQRQFPDDPLRPKDEVKVLVPGAGLGRLAFEIASRGYVCQGNEFSLFMLLASNFVLNKCCGVNLHSICPWVHQSINVLKADDQVKEAWFPDVNPADILCEDGQFSMAAGDFLEIYKEPDAWDCVATCFFIDCAHNIVEFVETIYRILKPGGVWINLGPLLYHFADMRGEDSIEPSFDILKDIIIKFGFEYLKDDTKVLSSYTQNPKSMMKYTYESVFFVCRKPSETEEMVSSS
ncbi:carnosine N-methyltransferase [Neocloeon triangulifer]|uniref:carnosine N-methyltransferase n=1 Tax=Neocloeon triangulifer TaxID=2078957 RepID=UPI00286F35E4|nr:carnosine N-methyltransferase [Neocloeon triangulifer]